MVTELNATEARAATSSAGHDLGSHRLAHACRHRRTCPRRRVDQSALGRMMCFRTLEMTKSERPDWEKVGCCWSAVRLRTVPFT